MSIHELAAEGDLPALLHLVTNKTLIKERDGQGATALYLASERGHSDVVRILIESGSDVNARKRKRWRPLHAAAKNGHAGVVAQLIAAGADVDRKTNRQMTPLMLAAKHGGDGAAARLIDSGCDVNARDMFARTAVHWAIKGGSPAILRRLVDSGASLDAVDRFNKGALHQAVKSDRAAMLAYLLSRGLDTSGEERFLRTPLHLAAGKGRPACLRVLLDRGLRPDLRSSCGRVPLQFAAARLKRSSVRTLLQRGADPDASDAFSTTALHEVALASRLPRARAVYDTAFLLVDANADVNRTTTCRVLWQLAPDRPLTALDIAAAYGKNAGLVKLLARSGTGEGNLRYLLRAADECSTPAIRMNVEVVAWLRDYYRRPRTLKEFCRMTIRKSVPAPFSGKLAAWDIPGALKDYLHFGDFRDMHDEYSEIEHVGDVRDSDPDGDSQGEYEASVFDSEYGDDPEIVDTDEDPTD